MNERILIVLREALENPQIDETCSQENCPMWDSLRHLNICFSLEGEFDIMFTPEEMTKMKSFEDIINIISTKL